MSKFLDVTMEARKDPEVEVEYKKPQYDWRFENSIANGKMIELDKEYSQWRTNSIIAGYNGCTILANEMNLNYNVTDEMHYAYMYATVRKERRKFKKKTDEEKRQEQEAKKYESLISLISCYYKYNRLRAKEALKILSAEQIDYIKQKQEKGGVKKNE